MTTRDDLTPAERRVYNLLPQWVGSYDGPRSALARRIVAAVQAPDPPPVDVRRVTLEDVRAGYPAAGWSLLPTSLSDDYLTFATAMCEARDRRIIEGLPKGVYEGEVLLRGALDLGNYRQAARADLLHLFAGWGKP